MKLITVLSFLIPFSLQSICAATALTEVSATPPSIILATPTEQSGNNFLLSDFPFMVEIKIYKNEIWLYTKIGGFVSKRWIIMTSYYEDNTPYLIFEILSPDYPRDGINTTKYFPFPKLLEHGDFVNNIALLDMGCDVVSDNFMKLPNYDGNWPSKIPMHKLQNFIADNIVNMELVEFDITAQKCHKNMFELCYNNNNFESNGISKYYIMYRRLNKDAFVIHFDINNSPVLIGIQTASQRQQQHQDQHYNHHGKCNRFLNIIYFWKWICAVTGINYFY